VRQAFETNAVPVPVRGRADFITYYIGATLVAF
jgi:hypothetical protein